MHERQYEHRQQGAGVMAMVLVLLMLGLLLLNGFNELSLSWKKQNLYERNYFKAYNQASSALVWGLQQHWPTPTVDWFCLTESHYVLTVCIKTSSQAGFTLIRGSSSRLSLFSLAEYKSVVSGANLSVSKGNWLDFCPEKKSSYCE